MEITYISLFSGIGGFEVGLQNSKHNFKCLSYSEIDKYAISIYSRHFPNHECLGDVTKIKTEDLPDFDFLVGGFPCQAFSVAGKRRGFDDTRGTLFFEIARILKDKRPRYFLLENVRGLLSHNKGETFKTILGVLSNLGYNVKWEIFNSKDFGVPQRRERIFIKGYFGRECGQEVLSFRRNNEKDTHRIKKDNRRVSNTYWGKRTGRVHYDDEIMNALACSGHNGGNRQVIVENKNIIQKNFSKVGDKFITTDKEKKNCYAVTTRPRGRPLHKKQDNYVLEGCIGSTQKHAARTDGSYAPTLTSAMGQGGGHVPMIKSKKIDETSKEDILLNYRIRRLTPLECERLQGFEDNWTEFGVNDEKISDTQRYKCIGNAVTTNVITAIVDEMFDGVSV